MKKILAIVLLLAVILPWASLALASNAPADTTAAGHAAAAPAAKDNMLTLYKALGAALAIGFAAFATALAQSRIGAAASGALAEKPEVGGTMIVLEALPETIIILGFVIALLIIVML
jgi:V/A-type H+-transporting ATPase subunit K